jgi:3-oxoacyl-[acyl-carrier protein] reductase
MTSGKKVILITGAAGGVGRRLAVGFASPSNRIAVHYCNRPDRADEVAREIQEQGGEAMTLVADLSIPAEVEGMVQSLLEAWGGVHVLINNAGIVRDAPVVSLSEEDWETTLGVNLSGPFYVMRAVSDTMREQGGGEIINVVSIAGVRGSRGQANYAASKSALLGLTRAAAREWGPYNIKVNAVSPGFMETDMTRTVPEQVKEHAREQSCLKSFCDPGDLVLFVKTLSRMRSVTGQVFHLDSRIV